MTDGKFTHIVLYKANPGNPKAAGQIIAAANRYLKPIAKETHTAFNAGRASENDRAVMGYDFDVGLSFIFDSRDAEKEYQKDPRHMKYVRFVLNGWMLKGSKSNDPQAEFIDYILHAKPGENRKHVRNPKIPDSQVVWVDEKVYQFGDDQKK